MNKQIYLILIAAVIVLCPEPGTAANKHISKGDKVTLDYTLSIQGNVVETSEGREPLVYIHGQQAIVPGLEKELEGLTVGEEKTFTVPPEKGYGLVNPNSFILYDKKKFTKDIPLKVGQIVEVPTKKGQLIPAAIVEVRDSSVMLNFNHPLSGFELNFHVKILNIE